MILLVAGLILLMIVLFIALQSYLSKDSKTSTPVITQEKNEGQTVELSEAFVVLIEKITDNHIMGYDIHNDKQFNKVIDQTVKVSDAYGNVLPLNQISTGDIVEINYQEEKDRIVSMKKSSLAHSWTRISGVTVDTETKQINIAGKNYCYTDEIIVSDSYGFKSNISNISAYDIVSIQAVEDTVWSIRIEEASASLNLSELPTSNGQIEIGNSRLIMFKDITEPIKLIPGKHKIVIKMQGYVPITTELVAEANEVYDIVLQDAEVAYTVIKPMISSSNPDYSIEDYTIKVGEKSYKPGEEIKVQQDDTYRIEISADNHKKWVTTVYLTQPTLTLKAQLTAIEEEDEASKIDTPSDEASSQTNNSSNTTNDNRVITINSDPTGANVYINNVKKGVTPYAVELTSGTYSILIEKTGYETYSAEIVLDANNNQESYLYQLKQKE